jgi:nickel/cobalt exporter
MEPMVAGAERRRVRNGSALGCFSPLAGVRRFAVIALSVVWGSLALPSQTVAHAFGTFSISVYSRLVVFEDQIQIRWVLDMAETPAAATVNLIDADGDGKVTDEEKHAYFDLWVGSVLDNIELTVDGRDLSKRIVDRELTLPAGEGGSPALRIVMDLTADVPAGTSRHTAAYRDANYDGYVGWREVAVASGSGARLIESSVPTEGRTNELTIYPADLGLSVPTSEATFVFAAADALAGPSTDATSPAATQNGGSGFQVWPTGILAAVLMLGLAGAMVVANRPKRR